MDASEDARDRLAKLMEITPPQAIAVVNHLGVADQLVDGPRSAADVAERCGVDRDALYRLLRFIASHGVFTEVERGQFALNDVAYWLRSDVERSVAWRVEGDTLVKPWYPWAEWLETIRTGEPAYDRMHGQSFWDALDADPAARAKFDASLRLIAERQIEVIVPQLPLQGCRTVIDVGAGDGSWLVAILRREQAARGVAFDLDQALSSLGEASSSDVGDRLTVTTGDFFEAVPNGDTIVLGNVLHDWNDERALRILQMCRAAISDDGRLLIVDRVLPEGDTPHRGKAVDMNMLFLLGGRERTRDEFTDLLTASQFELIGSGNEDGEVGWLHARPIARS